MSIQPPPSSRPREISVAEPVAPALERVKQMLFKPFGLAKWITIGFCAWLADLGESGGVGGGGNFNTGNHFGDHDGQPAEQLRQFYHKASDYVMFNLGWIIPVAILLVLFGVALWLLLLWLSSRGKFMFLHCVALDKAEVAEPWSQFVNEANSLFRFRIGLGLIGMILTLPLAVFMLLAILRMFLQGEADVAGVLTAVGLGLGLLLVAVVLAASASSSWILCVHPISAGNAHVWWHGGNSLCCWRNIPDSSCCISCFRSSWAWPSACSSLRWCW